MSTNYNRKDHFYKKAKDEGYRSRAAFKLVEIDDKYQLIKPGYRVIDLGAWPGGWLQVAAGKVGPKGKVVGIDLVAMESLNLPQVLTITGDVRDTEALAKASLWAEGPFNVVLSDMSPKLSGIKEVDREASTACAELAFSVATQLLAPDGALVIKVFKSSESDKFVKSLKGMFNRVVRSELDSSRNTSNEYYVIGLGFKK